MAGRFGGRESEKSGARGMAMDMNEAQLQQFRGIHKTMIGSEPQDWQWVGPHMSQRMFGISQKRAQEYASRHGGSASKMEAKDEYRDEQFENAEVARGEEEDLHGRWGGRGSDKAGARDIATDPPVSQAQRAAMHAAAEGKSTIGIPKSVGEEYANADPGGKLPAKAKDDWSPEAREAAAKARAHASEVRAARAERNKRIEGYGHSEGKRGGGPSAAFAGNPHYSKGFSKGSQENPHNQALAEAFKRFQASKGK